MSFVEETERTDGCADGTGRHFLFHRQINQVRADLFRAKPFGRSCSVHGTSEIMPFSVPIGKVSEGGMVVGESGAASSGVLVEAVAAVRLRLR